jgi:hypothetical protein
LPLTDPQLRELIGELVKRPGHEKVRSEIYRLLVGHLGASPSDVDFEKTLPEIRGRVDALLGRTVFEFKRDLRSEAADAEHQLAEYLSERERATGQSHFGIATDGVDFIPYELRRGKLIERRAFKLKRGDVDGGIRGLSLFLSPFLSAGPELRPEPHTIRAELGRESTVYEVASDRLRECWTQVATNPEVLLKRNLWAERLRIVYGTDVGDDALFFQHTYLTIVAKTMATLVLGAEVPPAADLLSGKVFHEKGLDGVVESDFFDWVLAAEGSEELIKEIAAQVRRFRLGEIEHDVLKALYESLIDPEQRHFLGEYYTPDWLAQWMCEATIHHPLEQRVLDPACGSGTFLFHAVKRFLDAAARARMSMADALLQCTEKVLGIDVHPVAVINARITYLLALGENILREHPPLSIPVYLGDSLQWEKGALIIGGALHIAVPDGPEILIFPAEVAQHPQVMDAVLVGMVTHSEKKASRAMFEAWLSREDYAHLISARAKSRLSDTFETLSKLHPHRNHIWNYVARNLSRPVWLSNAPGQKADVIVGNPPWLSYRYMSKDQQDRFKRESGKRHMWAGGKVATHQDLSAYFFVRCMELYLKPQGKMAFVMPHATMSRKQYRGFIWQQHRGEKGEVWAPARRFTGAWDLDQVTPLFNVPACVLFAENGDTPEELPARATAFAGQLPQRDASGEQAAATLKRREIPWPRPDAGVESAYAGKFRQGATVVPRRFFLVLREAGGRFGGNPDKPVVVSRVGALDKEPWKSIPRLRGAIEREFLRPLYLGESVAPFRLLAPAEAIIPWTAKQGLLDAKAAQALGYSELAGWLNRIEALWEKHKKNQISLSAQLDYFGKLTTQLPPPKLRVLSAASGKLPAAALLRDERAVAEHALYWASTATPQEALYLAAFLNSDALRKRAESKQARGQWGARHFDKLLAELIPEFDAANALHADLVKAAEHAEQITAAVELPENIHFIRARQKIREALRDDGVAQSIDELVDKLLG